MSQSNVDPVVISLPWLCGSINVQTGSEREPCFFLQGLASALYSLSAYVSNKIGDGIYAVAIKSAEDKVHPCGKFCPRDRTRQSI